MRTDNTISLGTSAALTNGLFVNNGVVRKTATTGATYFSSENFTNHGTVEAQSGTIRLNSGGTLSGLYNTFAGASIQFTLGAFTLDALPGITGQGVSQFTGGTSTILHDVAPNLLLVGGFVTLGPSFQNAGNITNLTLSGSTLTGTNTVTGTFNCASGTLGGGVLTNAPTGLIVLGSSNAYSSVYLQNLSLVNLGVVRWQSGYVEGGVGSAITNNNLWLIEGGDEMYGFSSAGFPFVNNGIIRQTTAGYSYIENPVFINNGAIDAEAGTID